MPSVTLMQRTAGPSADSTRSPDPAAARRQSGWAGKVVLITGAGAGIGFEFARQLHGRGAEIVAVSLGESELENLSQALGGLRLHTLAMDLTQADAGEWITTALDRAGLTVDVLINNAGMGLMGAQLDLDEALVLRMLALNILALTDLTTRIGRRMRDRRCGAILNVASTAGFQPLPQLAAYAASKHYVLAFTQAIAAEMSSDGVHVATLCPGTTRTSFLDKIGLDVSQHRNGSLSDWAARVAMTPAQVAAVGIRALENRRNIAVPGWLNRLHHLASRILPTAMLMGIAARVFLGRPSR